MRRDWQKGIIFPLGIFLFVFLSSCGWLTKEQLQKEEGWNQEAQKQQVQKQIDYADKRARMEIEAGNFQSVIDLYGEIYRKRPQDPNVRSGYIKALESIKSKGDQAFGRGDFKGAEKNYELLVRNWIYFSDFGESLSFRKSLLETRIKTSRCFFTEEQVSSCLKAGEFRKALDLCKEISQKYPQDLTVRNGYARTLGKIKTQGDRAFEKRDFALAGSVYEMLLRNVSSVSPSNGSSSFSKEELTTKISNCRKVLFENGLKQYRSGNLNQAISLWKSILAFDPENREIEMAVNMATLQLENLQKTK